MNSVKWISSLGGPLILLPGECLSMWNKSSGSSNHSVHSDDYARACSINDYVAAIRVQNCLAVVFGDVPQNTTWYRYPSRTGGIIVRIEYISYEEDEEIEKVAFLENYISQMEDIWSDTSLIFPVNEDPLYLFDAATSGDNIVGKDPDSYIVISLPTGNYSVSSLFYRPNSETSLVLHRFLLDESISVLKKLKTESL